MKVTTLLPILALGVGVGCANSVTGTVDGDAIPGVATAYLVSTTLEDVEIVSVVLTTIPDACEVQKTVLRETESALEAYFRAQEDASSEEELDAAAQTFVAEMTRIDRENLPEEFWTTSVSLVAQGSANFEGSKIKLGPAADEDSEGITANVQVVHRTRRVEPTEALTNDSDAVRFYLGQAGQVAIDRYTAGDRIEGTGEATLADGLSESGDDVGAIELSFAAEHCDLDA